MNNKFKKNNISQFSVSSIGTVKSNEKNRIIITAVCIIGILPVISKLIFQRWYFNIPGNVYILTAHFLVILGIEEFILVVLCAPYREKIINQFRGLYKKKKKFHPVHKRKSKRLNSIHMS